MLPEHPRSAFIHSAASKRPLVNAPLTLFRVTAASCLLCATSALSAEGVDMRPQDAIAATISPELQQRIATLAVNEGPLNEAKLSSPDCETGCLTPSEAVALAFAAGEGETARGRFLLDIRGGGQSLDGELGELLFVNSHQDYAQFGTLTIAFEERALFNLLRRASVCRSNEYQPGRIAVNACRRDANFDLNMFTMMQRLHQRRIAVDGEVRLQWIDARTGLPRPTLNKRGEREAGYYQVWIRVEDADQVIFVHTD